MAVIGIVLLITCRSDLAIPEDPSNASVNVILILFVWLGGFIGCYGRSTFRKALFPLVFLLFAVPIPRGMLETIILVLQKGSAEVAHAMIKLGGVPVAREGVIFTLPSMSIEVAPECSGIRSVLSLAVTGSLAAYFFLNKKYGQDRF